MIIHFAINLPCSFSIRCRNRSRILIIMIQPLAFHIEEVSAVIPRKRAENIILRPTDLFIETQIIFSQKICTVQAMPYGKQRPVIDTFAHDQIRKYFLSDFLLLIQTRLNIKCFQICTAVVPYSNVV